MDDYLPRLDLMIRNIMEKVVKIETKGQNNFKIFIAS